MKMSRFEKAKRNQKKHTIRLRLFVVCPMIVFTLTSCALGSNSTSAPAENSIVASKIVSSNYHTVEKGTALTTLIGTGKIVPTQTTSLYFNNVSGPLHKLNFGLNDQVKKNDLFAEIMPTGIQNRIEAERLTVEKGKARLKLLRSNPTDIQEILKSIELTQSELTNLLDEQKNLPVDNALTLEKARLALEQLGSQMKSSLLSKELAELDGKQDEGAVEKVKIRLDQIKNEITSAESAIAQQKLVNEDLVKTGASQNEIKLASLRLEQLELSLTNSKKNQEIAELDLQLAHGTQNTEGTENDLSKSDLRIKQAELGLESIRKALEIAELSLEQVARSSDENIKATKAEISSTKTRLEQLRLQLASLTKNNEFNLLQAEYDQKSAELSLKILEENLANSQLYSPVDGVVSQLGSYSITDMIGNGQLIAKIADTSKLVFQFTATDARYVTEASRAKLTIGVEEYDVEIYKPQPGDSFLQNNNTNMNDQNHLYVKFKGQIPDLKFEELVQAQIEVEKQDVLLVPITNVRVENGKILVDMLKGKEIVTTEIVRGIETDTMVEVMNGLKVGDQIVLR